MLCIRVEHIDLLSRVVNVLQVITVLEELFRLLACGWGNQLSVQGVPSVVDMFGLHVCDQEAISVCNMLQRGKPNGSGWRCCRSPTS